MPLGGYTQAKRDLIAADNAAILKKKKKNTPPPPPKGSKTSPTKCGDGSSVPYAEGGPRMKERDNWSETTTSGRD